MSLREFLRRHHRILFYAAWTILGWVQAAGTGLLDDEAYYWVYSKFMAWGYFDHPPLIALLIRIGYALSAHEWGVRLLPVLLGTGTLMAIHSLLEKKNDRLFYAIALGMAVIQLGGFLAVPDVPLVFFTALFFLAYRSFLNRGGWVSAITLGLVAAAMLYSKYHGVLVIGFTLLSHPRLLLLWRTWLAGGIIILLFLPHLYWQYEHGFPSVQYHLFERSAVRYKSLYTFEYVWSQLLFAGPLIGWLLIWSAARYRPVSLVEKALKWCFAGIYLLFWLSTFKGRAQANWTIPAFIPLIILAHQYLCSHNRLARWVYASALPVFLLVMAVRVYMVLDVKPLPWLAKDEFHKTSDWARSIQRYAAGRPVVFINSYQDASQYWFYTGQQAFSLNNIFYRRSNFNFWPLEAPLQGKAAVVVDPHPNAIATDTIRNAKKNACAGLADPYFSQSQALLVSPSVWVARGSQLRTRVWLSGLNLARDSERYQNDSSRLNLTLYYRNRINEVSMATLALPLRLKDLATAAKDIEISLPDSLPYGKIRARWAVDNCVPGLPSLNSAAYTLVREPVSSQEK